MEAPSDSRVGAARGVLVFPRFPPQPGRKASLPPLGILALRAHLKTCGREVLLVDGEGEGAGPDEIVRRLLPLDPSFVGLSLSTAQMSEARMLLRKLRQALPDCFLLAGGPHPSAIPRDTMEELVELDAVIVGEGELTMAELLDRLEEAGPCESPKGSRSRGKLADLLGLVWRDAGGVIHENDPRPRLSNLDSLPMLDRGELRLGGAVFPSLAWPSTQVMASRGCPEGCSFCCRAVFGRRHVRRSVGSVLKELDELDGQGIREVFFQDDTLNLDPDWLRALCDGIIEQGLHERLLFKGAMRAEPRLLPRDMLRRCRQAGFWMIFFGVESGSPELLAAMGKGTTLEGIRESLLRVEAEDIRRYVSIIIGTPGESCETVDATLAFLADLDPEFWGVATATPFPGTAMRHEAEKRCLLQERDWSDYDLATPLMGTGVLSSEEVGHEVRRATLALWRHEDAFETGRRRFRRWKARMGSELALLHSAWGGNSHRLDHVPWWPGDLAPGRLGDQIEPAAFGAAGLGPGWHALEEGDVHRWCDEEASFYMRRPPGAEAIEVEWRVDHPRLRRRWVSWTLSCNGVLLGRMAGKGPSLQRARLALPSGGSTLSLRISVRPGQREEGDWDRDRPPRSMGIALLRARVL